MVGTNLKQDEVASVLQKGEYVIDKNTTAQLSKGGQSSGNINIRNYVGPEDVANALRGSQTYQNDMLNVVRSNADEIKSILRL